MLKAYYHNVGIGIFWSAILSFVLLTAPVRSFAEDAATPSEDKEITITGSVEKAAIDEKGAVIAVEIWVEQGDSYDYFLVNDTPKGNELIPHVGSKVTLTAVLEEDEDGNKILTVKSYTVLK
jgi:hypothetical protein